MTKKRSSSSSSSSSSFVRPLFSLGSKLVISLSALLCILAFLRLHSQQTISNSPTLHTFNDHFEGSLKVTFLFLTCQNLPLDFVWHSFFKASENSGIVDLCHFAFYAFAGRTGRLQWSRKNEILGTPTREEIKCMNPNYIDFKFSQIKAHPWHKVFHKQLPAEAVDLVSRLLQYSPNLHCTTVIRKE